jgi:hypothetical protein
VRGDRQLAGGAHPMAADPRQGDYFERTIGVYLNKYS